MECAVSSWLPPNHVEEIQGKASCLTAPFQISFEGNFKAPVVTCVCTFPPLCWCKQVHSSEKWSTMLKVRAEKWFTVLWVGRGVQPQSEYCQSALPVGPRQLISSAWLKVMMISLQVWQAAPQSRLLIRWLWNHRLQPTFFPSACPASRGAHRKPRLSSVWWERSRNNSAAVRWLQKAVSKYGIQRNFRSWQQSPLAIFVSPPSPDRDIWL